MGRLCEKCQSSVPVVTPTFLYLPAQHGVVSIATPSSEPQCPFCKARGAENDDGSYDCPQPDSVCRVQTFVEDTSSNIADPSETAVGSFILNLKQLLGVR